MTANNKLTFGERSVYLIDPHFPPLILQELTNQVKALPYTRSQTGSPGKEEFNSIRTSNNSWLCWDTWVAGIMHNMFVSANNDYFYYNLDHFDSGIQATRYEVGQNYDWHVDAGDGDGTNGKPLRKLSMSLVLDSEFEGGELEIFHAPQHKVLTFDIKPGTVCIFPSWVSHRVKPVTSGTRYSLVAWMNGPEFK